MSQDQRAGRSGSQVRKTASVTSLPSPPPAIPLPPLPGVMNAASAPASQGNASGRHSKDIASTSHIQIAEDQEARIRTIEKHLFAEKQLTSTLEEALTDLERQSNKVKADCDAWKRRASELDSEIEVLKKEKQENEKGRAEHRMSLTQVEEERKRRREAEIAKAQLEERMNAINRKKKKGSLNCF
jgi:hypothetical protein